MSVTPYGQATTGKKEQVGKMFDSIAFRYDLLNQLLSMGIHHRWRKSAVEMLRLHLDAHPSHLLDVATGTAALALDALALNPSKITGIDISADMLDLGRKKIEAKQLTDRIHLQQADSEALPFPDSGFDGALVGFGVRNFENLDKGLSEIARVLKPGAPLAVLEFSIPKGFPMNYLYRFYLSVVCPVVGRIVSGDPVAYDYLFRSVQAFPYGEELRKILLRCGFSHAEYRTLTFGIVTVYLAKK